MGKKSKQHEKARNSPHNLFHPGDRVTFKRPERPARTGHIVEKRADRLTIRTGLRGLETDHEIMYAEVEYVKLLGPDTVEDAPPSV